MDLNSVSANPASAASREARNRELFEKQKALLDTFLERGAISKAQYDKSLAGLKEKMKM